MNNNKQACCKSEQQKERERQQQLKTIKTLLNSSGKKTQPQPVNARSSNGETERKRN
jgi:hypothetical protein